MLHDANSNMDNERKRQMEHLRLRREAKRAQAEEKFGTAALVIGAAKNQQAALDAHMTSDR